MIKLILNPKQINQKFLFIELIYFLFAIHFYHLIFVGLIFEAELASSDDRPFFQSSPEQYFKQVRYFNLYYGFQ